MSVMVINDLSKQKLTLEVRGAKLVLTPQEAALVVLRLQQAMGEKK